MALPSPWGPLGSARIVHIVETGSTNAKAMRLAVEGAPSGLWVLADTQSAGRGRSGRDWVSPAGNLHASLLIRDVFPLEKAAQLAIVSGVAVHSALVAATGGALSGQLELKWPNDILCDRRKLGGILVESSVANRGEGALAVVGIGVNLAHHPEIPDRPTTDLSRYGAAIAPLKLLAFLDERMQEWVSIWASGDGFWRVREEWLARSLPPGVGLTVHTGQGLMHGTFAGMDPDGALLLQVAAGRLLTVTFGDVALAN